MVSVDDTLLTYSRKARKKLEDKHRLQESACHHTLIILCIIVLILVPLRLYYWLLEK